MFEMIGYGELINKVDEDKVQQLIESIINEGWKGAPILHHQSIGLITGSHRTAALRRISDMYENDELTEKQREIVEEIDRTEVYYYDVTDIIDDCIEKGIELEYDNLERVFKGTEVEQWKEEIEEW